ncbi:MAG: phosphatidate cytidylyltransferase [candidate division Zixibacteria bacterium]|nr:phosphatidate cytidylyltransferase [candidate division Zixibacteria bacterium]MDD5425887.1 phosphatidate cytidylyltransferase [candidate division Zixibacteria bacterium]
MSKNLAARIAVALIAIPVILWICYQGGWWLYAMVLLFALVGFGEFIINEGYRWYSPVTVLSFIFVFILFSVSTLAGKYIQLLESDFWGSGSNPAFPLVLLFFGVTAMLFSIGEKPPAELFKRHSRLLWGVLYIGLLYPYVFLLGDRIEYFTNGTVDGGDCLLFLFGLLWVGDTAAMAAGSWLGRHKLAPAVSPNKTIEGFIGGIAGALIIGVIMFFWKFQDLPFYHLIILSIGCSVCGQLGDLVESMWKRSLNIKDSSAIIPGHGGVLDRFDSLLFAAPFMFMYLVSFIK